ncbi:hypothetical protein [Aeromonas caviae]|uniref:hypothetical protein n=1 Tax=Aeromonas caviae TaxID=648 RepID=UPI001CC73F76|nr:hypothetical protein [Aeromonas caviae]
MASLAPLPFRCLRGLLGGLGLVLLPLQRLKLPGKSCGLLAGLCCHLASLVTLGLRLPGFLRCCGAGGVVGLCSLGGLLLDLLGAGCIFRSKMNTYSGLK